MNKLKILAMNISKKNKIFRKMARKSMYVLKRTKYVLTGMNKKVDNKIIVFSCFNGK